MRFPTEDRAGLTTWTDPLTKKHYTVIIAPDFGVTKDALESWRRYSPQLEQVEGVLVSFAGIETLPYSEHDLAHFVALGEKGTALALSGANCGYGGEGPHGSEKILREIGLSETLARLVFERRELRYVRLKDGWMAELGGEGE